MSPRITRLLPLGLASLCLAWTGCGGSDVPDPDSDQNAAPPPVVSNTPPPVPAAPAAPAAPAKAKAKGAEGEEDVVTPASETPAAKVAAAEPPPAKEAEPEAEAPAAKAAMPAEPAKAAESVAETEAAKPAAEAEAGAGGEEAAAKPPSESSATTAEMLALGNKPVAAPADAEGSANGGQGAGPAGGRGPGGQGAPGGQGGPGRMPIPGGGPGGAGGQDQAKMMAMMQAQAAANQNSNRAMPGAPIMPGGPNAGGSMRAPGAMAPGGGAPGSNERADFHTPEGAVTAFLDALKAKDLVRLSEATALRSTVDSSAKNRKIFSTIVDGSMTEDDLADLANKLDGFNIVGENDPKSSGRIGITIGKTNDRGDQLMRTVTVRHEKAGWKVLDISGQGVIKNPFPNIRGRGQGTRNR